jgi:putative transposase
MDHVHLIVSIPPSIAIASFVGTVKGVSTAIFNRTHPGRAVQWQHDYAIFSFGRQSLSHHVLYVRQQEKHHRNKKTIAVLERTGENSS